MTNKIYLARQANLEEGFFLRIIKDIKQQSFEIDHHFQADFSPGQKGKLDVLKIWIKPSDKPYPSVLISDRAVIENAKRRTEKVRIRLINSQTGKTVDQTVFDYKEAFLENHIDDWSDRLKLH